MGENPFDEKMRAQGRNGEIEALDAQRRESEQHPNRGREKPGQDKYRPTQATPISNFFLAGSYTYQDYLDSMEGATRSGLMVADEIIARADGPSGLKAQAAQVMKNLEAVLEAAGVTFAHVVRSTIYLADLEDFAAVNEVYAARFPAAPPARACVQVARLPRDARVEIDCVAVAGDV